MNKTKEKYSMEHKIKELEKRGFTHTRVGMTNGKYAFIYYQIDSDTMSDAEWDEYIQHLDKEIITTNLKLK